MHTRVYLAVFSEDETVQTAFSKAHMAYDCGGKSFHLQTQALPLGTSGGLLVLGDRQVPAAGDCHPLARQVAQECARRRYVGVLADFENPPDAPRRAILSALSPFLQKMNLPLVVPEAYADCVPGTARVLVSAAISGGTLTERLQAAAERWPGRVWLELRRLRMDFPLPCPSGEGTPLDAQAFEDLKNGRLSFYSQELGCHYFTYSEGDTGHFVLFDSPESLQRKWALAQSFGITHAVLLYPEVADILGPLETLLL